MMPLKGIWKRLDIKKIKKKAKLSLLALSIFGSAVVTQKQSNDPRKFSGGGSSLDNDGPFG